MIHPYCRIQNILVFSPQSPCTWTATGCSYCGIWNRKINRKCINKLPAKSPSIIPLWTFIQRLSSHLYAVKWRS